MNIEFNHLPPDARIWIYAASRILSDSEQSIIKKQALEFTENWAAHQVPLKASFAIVDNIFLVFGVDIGSHDISGCGIDKSVHLVQKWEQQLGLSLFNRMQLEYTSDNNIYFANKTGVADALEKGLINDETLFYNKTIDTVHELKTRFIIPLKQSWVYSQLPKHTA